MKTSVLITAASAAMAMAGPVQNRAYVTVVETAYETATVTAGQEAAKATPVAAVKQRPQTTQEPEVVVVTQTYTPETEEPEPEPTTPTAVVVTITQGQEQPEETSEAPAPTTEEAVYSSVVAAPEPTAPSDDDFEGNALYHHNLHRSNHSSPEMLWDSKIASYASNTADTCKWGHDMDQGDGGYGQNIAMWAISSGAEDLGDAGAIKMATTDMWYTELGNYPTNAYGASNPDMSGFESWGHYTQLIWKGSNKLGCAVKLCTKGSMVSDMDAWFMVCNYGPPGNIADAYGENVLSPLGLSAIIGV